MPHFSFTASMMVSNRFLQLIYRSLQMTSSGLQLCHPCTNSFQHTNQIITVFLHSPINLRHHIHRIPIFFQHQFTQSTRMRRTIIRGLRFKRTPNPRISRSPNSSRLIDLARCRSNWLEIEARKDFIFPNPITGTTNRRSSTPIDAIFFFFLRIIHQINEIFAGCRRR